MPWASDAGVMVTVGQTGVTVNESVVEQPLASVACTVNVAAVVLFTPALTVWFAVKLPMILRPCAVVSLAFITAVASGTPSCTL